MKYEIPREIFKQRLNNRLNFKFVDVQPKELSQKIVFADVDNIPYSSSFADELSKNISDKAQNIIVYSLTFADESPKLAAEALSDKGYQFVYYYCGSDKDIVLDKGLN